MIKKNLVELFKEIFDSSPGIFSSAPGRINIIGEHTDYTGGYVLPAAIHLRNYFLAGKRSDRKIHLWSQNFEQRTEFSLDSLSFSFQNKWENYLKGILWTLKKEGFRLSGINGLIWGDIPLEAGLSSSAALEISILEGLDRLFVLGLDKRKKVLLAQQAENEFVGVMCGIMDQFISVFGEKKRAIYLDCETLEFAPVPFDPERENVSILVYDTRKRRELASSEYNRRRQESGQAALFLKKKGYSSFKEISRTALQKLKKEMDEVLYTRALHVVTENARVKKAVRMLREKNFWKLGQLLFQSHSSLRDNYQVSCPELDLLYQTGKNFPACLGARLTGAGFGGSGIALVRKESLQSFMALLLERAEKNGFPKPEMYEVMVDRGAEAELLT